MAWMDLNEYSLIEGAVRDRVDELRQAAETKSRPAASIARAHRERQLVDALRRRTPTAAARLTAAYGDRVYRLAIRLTGNAQEAEEIVQETFRTVLRKIDTFSGHSGFRSWLYRVVAAAAGRKLRRRRCWSAHRSLDEVLPRFDACGRHATPIVDWSASVGDPLLQPELRRVLSSAITELPTEDRMAVILHDVEGLSNWEIGEVLEISLPGVRSRVHRARLFLRRRLSEYLARVRVIDGKSTLIAVARVSAACGQ